MGKYTGVIFDLDGVICFTDKYHYQAWKAVADKLGIYFDETINNRLRGVSRMDSLEIILERYDGKLTAQEKEALAEEKNALYRRLLANMSPADLSAEVKETLDALRGMGLWALRLQFTTENPSEIDKVLMDYQGRAVFDAGSYTRGLYSRGVE